MKRLIRSEYFPLVLLITANIIIGLLILPAYGESWDEAGLFNYAERSLRAYDALMRHANIPVSLEKGDPYFGDHGPAFVMLVVLIHRLVAWLGFVPSIVDVAHFVYFLTFQIGVISLYLISRRWMSPQAALCAALLFSTQPLLWGHSFINPKDAPFMSFFLASVASGLWMVDRVKDNGTMPKVPSLLDELTLPSRIQRGHLLFYSFLWLILILVLLLWGTDLVESIISKAFQGGSNSLLGRIFLQVASHTEEVAQTQYVEKALKLFGWFINFSALFSFILVCWVLYVIAPFWARASGKWLGGMLRALFEAFISPDVMLASLILGFTTAIRIAAPMAGLLVLLYVVMQKKWRAFPWLLAYAILSIALFIVFWPSLWPAPMERFVASIFSSSRYPAEVQTLFAGKFYFPNQIPRLYLPILLGYQLTESTLLLVLLGVFVSLKRKMWLGYHSLLHVWFFLPFLWFIVSRTSLYDNFRHVLFILPPLFVLAGIGFDWLFGKLSVPVYRYLVLVIAILPALIANVSLHPYQYVYYNQLAGGLSGVYRSYQLDYWDVSYREAALYINRVAPENASVVPVGPYLVMLSYLRPDLQLVDPIEATGNWQAYNYIVVNTRNNEDLAFSQYPTIYSVGRMGAVFTVVKQP